MLNIEERYVYLEHVKINNHDTICTAFKINDKKHLYALHVSIYSFVELQKIWSTMTWLWQMLLLSAKHFFYIFHVKQNKKYRQMAA